MAMPATTTIGTIQVSLNQGLRSLFVVVGVLIHGPLGVKSNNSADQIAPTVEALGVGSQGK
jgi:hypothetical protein